MAGKARAAQSMNCPQAVASKHPPRPRHCHLPDVEAKRQHRIGHKRENVVWACLGPVRTLGLAYRKKREIGETLTHPATHGCSNVQALKRTNSRNLADVKLNTKVAPHLYPLAIQTINTFFYANVLRQKRHRDDGRCSARQQPTNQPKKQAKTRHRLHKKTKTFSKPFIL